MFRDGEIYRVASHGERERKITKNDEIILNFDEIFTFKEVHNRLIVQQLYAY